MKPSAAAGLLFVALVAAAGSCRPASGLHVEVQGALVAGVEFDRLSLEVRRASTQELLSREEVAGAELRLPYSFNLLGGASTPAGTMLQLTVRALLGATEVARVDRLEALSTTAIEVRLSLQPTPPGGMDGGVPDAGCVPTSATEVCGNQQDDDCDGLRECADPDCAAKACGPNGAVCTSNQCVCSGSGGVPETVEQSCGDTRDNDCDGLVDCADPDCANRACNANARFSCEPAANSCACNAQERVVDAARVGPSALAVGADSAERVLYLPSGGGVLYSECTAGCASASPTFSTPVSLANLTANPNYRPLLAVTQGGALEAAFKTNRAGGERLTFAACSSNCSQAASWTQRDFGGDGTTAGFETDGTLRAVAYQNNNGTTSTSIYAECSGQNCATGAATWSNVSFNFDPYGADVAFFALPGGGTKRGVVYGNENGGGMFYAECQNNCGTAGNWATVTLPTGYLPELVFDSNGLPRVFYSDGNAPSAVRCTRCTTQPCSSAANWTSTLLNGNASHVSVGKGADGGTFCAMSSGGNVLLGVENASGGYTVAPVPGCSANVSGDTAAVAQDPNGRWHFSYSAGTAQRVFSELR